jgi:hypothetical protein
MFDSRFYEILSKVKCIILPRALRDAVLKIKHSACVPFLHQATKTLPSTKGNKAHTFGMGLLKPQLRLHVGEHRLNVLWSQIGRASFKAEHLGTIKCYGRSSVVNNVHSHVSPSIYAL